MQHHTAHPLWYQIHSVAANVAELTATVIQHSREFTAAAVAQRATDDAQLQERPLRFEDVGATESKQIADVPDDISVEDASFSKHLA